MHFYVPKIQGHICLLFPFQEPTNEWFIPVTTLTVILSRFLTWNILWPTSVCPTLYKLVIHNSETIVLPENISSVSPIGWSEIRAWRNLVGKTHEVKLSISLDWLSWTLLINETEESSCLCRGKDFWLKRLENKNTEGLFILLWNSYFLREKL